MATGNKLEVTIGADVTDFKKKIQEVESDIRDLSKVKLDQLKLGLDTREINAQIKDAKNSLATLKDSVGKTGNAIGGQFTKQTANGGNALMQFSRIAQDAPYGIIGIGNNLTATAEAFSYLKNQTGSTGGALKALGSSLMGSGGILLGVSLLTTGFTLLSQSGLSVGDVIDKLTGKAESFAKTLSKVNDEAYKDKGVQEAITNVNELTNEIELAKNGFLDKDKVVEHYNETIGKTTGLVSSLDEAEKEITKNGDAYIKMTLYKAAANLALQEAAKASLETERTRLKSLKDFASVTDDLSSSAKSTTGLGDAMSADEYKALQKSRVKAQKQRKDDEIKINTDAAQQNLNIAKKFQDDAAKIAKGFGFNFFGDTKATKEKAAKQDNSSFELEKQRLERIIEINKEILASENTLYYDRLSSQKAFSNATIALIDITKTKELRDSKNTENDKLRITEDAANKTVDTKNKLANQMHAGHVYSRGSNPMLRFNLHNIHRQSAQSNHFQIKTFQEVIYLIAFLQI